MLDVGVLVCIECGREQRGAASPVPAPAKPAEVAVAEAPAQVCPKHPGMPVAGACPRCGAFVCIRCAPGAANDVLTCGDCLQRATVESYPSPFGGVLVLPLLGAVFNVMALVGAAVITAMSGRWVAMAAIFAFVVLIGVTLAGFLMRKRWVPIAMAVIYLANIGISLLANPRSQWPWLAWCALWLFYFVLAERVKRTFVT